MSNPARLALARASLHYYRWRRRRRRDEILDAFRQGSGAPDGSAEWIPLSRWLAVSHRRDCIMMMVGPRWNTGAVLALTPVFDLHARLTVDAAEANRACRHWTVVVYDEGLKTIASIGSRSTPDSAGSTEIELEPGRYFLALRYYEPADDARFPAVSVDGRAHADARAVGDEPGHYAEALRALGHRRRIDYRLMHYHAYAMLRERDRFDEATLRQHYLPVGNPETAFAFGAIEPGERLRINRPATPGTRTYVTFYGVDSIPCAWHTIETDDELSPPAPERGTYLVRRLYPAESTTNEELVAESVRY